MQRERSFNIILFGETGVGKSSVINLLAGEPVAETSSNLQGCTMESRKYTFQVDGRTFNIWDTVGLREPVRSRTNSVSAINKAYTLIKQIGIHGGLDLLLFCMPGNSGITPTIQCNYRLFFEVLCEERIPIAVVVTHLEEEATMDEWWRRNVKHVSECGLRFSGHACVTGLPGHAKATEGRDSLERLLLDYDLKGGYIMPPASDGFLGIWKRFRAIIPKVASKQSQLKQTLRDRCMMPDEVAKELAVQLTQA